ncbi:MAG: magnesium transporter [bacterium]|nr:magnesium transporter [bacterium]
MALLSPEIKELLKDKDFDSLKAMLSELEPADIAELIKPLPPHSKIAVFNLLEFKIALEVFEQLEVHDEIDILKYLDKSKAAELLNEMSPNDRADLFIQLTQREAQRFLSLMREEEARNVKELISYLPHTAGGIMTTEFAWLPDSVTTGEAIDFLRREKIDFDFYQIYVLSDKRQPLGIISLKGLITYPSDTPIKKIMTKIPAVPLNMDQEKVAKLIYKYDLASIPVVDSDKKIRGIVKVDDAIDVIEAEHTEDAHKFGAVTSAPEDYLSAKVINIAKSRVIWLIVLLIASFMSGTIIEKYSYVLNAMVSLTIFIPLLLDSAGNAGTQAATVVVRGLAIGEIEFSSIWRVVRKEFLTGILMGIGLGILTAMRALVVKTSPLFGLTVGISMVAGICVATTIGGILPIIFQKLKLDPALMSSPLLTTIMDSTTLLIYFGVAIKILQI